MYVQYRCPAQRKLHIGVHNLLARSRSNERSVSSDRYCISSVPLFLNNLKHTQSLRNSFVYLVPYRHQVLAIDLSVCSWENPSDAIQPSCPPIICIFGPFDQFDPISRGERQVSFSLEGISTASCGKDMHRRVQTYLSLKVEYGSSVFRPIARLRLQRWRRRRCLLFDTILGSDRLGGGRGSIWRWGGHTHSSRWGREGFLV